MEGKSSRGWRGFFQGCNSFSQKIFARASSSESLEDSRPENWKGASSGNGLKKRLTKLAPLALVNKLKGDSNFKNDKPKPGLGTLSGVLIPTCENMWGVLIFLRFYYIVGNAGVWQSFLLVFLSFLCAILTTMSLSAIATNGPMEEGGTYYLISRALGPKLGGSVGIMYYLGVSLLAVLETLGAVEMLLFTFPGAEFSSANRVIAAMILLVLCFLVYFGISFVSKLSLVFFAVVIYTMLSYYLGLFTAPRGNAPDNLTGLKWETFKGNWNSGYESGVSFPVALAIFFPCFTGILSGADRAKNLARPEKSIPAGTIGAVTISLVMYLSYMGFWSAVGTRDYLLGREADGTERPHAGSNGSGGNLEVVNDVAFPLAILTQLGIIIASMAQAFQCLITSPRLLQAIASDGVIPFLSRLAKTSKNGEPRAALLATTVLCVLAAMIGSLDAVAPLVSICFLTAYSALNFSCFVLSVLKAPSWRPKWKFYHWSAALVGFLLCFAVNFVIKYYWAIVAVAVQVIIYIYIDYRQVEVDWGTGLGGLRLQLAVQSILSVGHEARYSVNWRPQLLCLCKPRSARAPDDHDNQEFMLFVSHLKKGRGLCVVATILEGSLEKMAPQVEAERLELENTMQAASVSGFARVLVAPSYKEGKTYAIQSSGLGALEPNTLVLGWPNKWYEEEHYHSAKVMLEILDECKAVDKAVLLCMNLDEFPISGTSQEGYIDVWWIVHDGGLLLILAHLLKQHKIWRKCKLRVHTVSEQIHDPILVKRNLKSLLDRIRITAEVQVIDMDTGGLAPYTYDTTLRIEEARAYAEVVLQYRLAQEQQNKSVETQGKQASTMPPGRIPSVPRSKSGDRKTLDNIFKDRGVPNQVGDTPHLMHGGKSPDRNVQGEVVSDAADNKSTINNQGRRVDSVFSRGDHDQENAEQSLKQHESIPKPGRNVDHVAPLTLTKTHSSGHSQVDQILKRSVPAELSMLEGVPHQPRPRNGPLHGLKTELTLDCGSTDRSSSLVRDQPSPRTSKKKMERSESSKGFNSPRPGGRQSGEFSAKDNLSGRLSCTPTTISTMGRDEEPENHSPSQPKGRTSSQFLKFDSAGSRSFGHDSEAEKSVMSPTASGAEESKNLDPNLDSRKEKETRWADYYGHKLEGGDQVEINIVEEESDDDHDEKMMTKEEEEAAGTREMVRTGSAGQLYPGSPHNSDYGGGAASESFPEAFNRTWETFSQNYSAKKLNEIIMEQSKDAQLVLLNLPDHYQGMEPARYMEYCEEVTRGLRRVLLVHGTGKEIWNAEKL